MTQLSFLRFNRSLENLHPVDVFTFMNHVTELVTLNPHHYEDRVRVLVGNSFEEAGITELMTKVTVVFTIAAKEGDDMYQWSTHRAKDFSCSNAGCKRIDR